MLLLLRRGGAHRNIPCVAPFWTARFYAYERNVGACTVLQLWPYFRLHKIYPRRKILYMYINVFFWPFGIIFSLPAAGLSSCSRLRGTQGAHPDPACKFGPWPRSVARALGVQSGKSARGRIPSTYSDPSLCKLTYRLKECPTSHVISGISYVINVVRHYILGDGFFFLRHQHARHATIYIILN